jgi:S-methylmethionine-dependent homocysteine/selenocysteine methylase
VAISFTVGTDGRLAGGETPAEAIATVDAAASPEYFQVNLPALAIVGGC